MNETGLRYLLSLERMEGCLPPECAYIDSIPALRSLDRLRFSQPVTFFVGENGSGKSTLLEAIAANYGLNPEGGSANFHFSTQSTHSALYRAIRLGKSPSRPQDAFFLRAESFYNVASEVDRLEAEQPGMLDSYGGISLHGQSHGESFLSLVLHRFRGRGLYLLDEPEAALSPLRQLSLLRAMRDLVARTRNSSSPRIPPSSWPIRARKSSPLAKTAFIPFPMRKPSTTRSPVLFSKTPRACCANCLRSRTKGNNPYASSAGAPSMVSSNSRARA